MTPEAVVARLRRGNRFLLVSHVNPDGDAIGSELGLARILAELGKSTTVWNRHPTPALYLPLPGADRIHVGAEPPAGFPERFDAAVVLECPALERTGLAEALAALPLLNVDHHLGNQHYGEVNWVEADAPAVGEMVFRLARALHATIDTPTANCLLLALSTDTGGFRFSNSTPAAFEAAAALVRAGARPEIVSHWLYESVPAPAVRLLGEMLATLEIAADGRVATVVLTRAMFARAGAEAGDSEGLVDTPRSILGVEAVALLKEVESGWKASLRSRGAVDVEAVARRHGGGGHRNAAGCTLAGDLATCRSTLLAELAAAVAGAAVG
ncbi:MAG: bifunctional oligoribonuclease/PAP phosphatase NrnA [Thermoanaerobaculia bacterium]